MRPGTWNILTVWGEIDLKVFEFVIEKSLHCKKLAYSVFVHTRANTLKNNKGLGSLYV